MYILSLDTTAKTASAAVSKCSDNKVLPLCDVRLNCTLTHSESILPMIDYCLKNTNLSIDDIDVLAISAGPGSFTGVRIGISTVKGLAFGNENVKCIPVSALESLAENLSDESKGTVICACMDARRNQFYNALFSVVSGRNIKRLTDDRAVSAEDLYGEICEKYSKRRIVLVGDGASLAYKLFSEFDGFSSLKIIVARGDRVLQDACSVARCAFKNLHNAVLSENLSPVYLRLSQAERERNERMGMV